MTDVRFAEAGDRIRVKFPYDAELVALLKDVVPSFARSWDRESKTWTIDNDQGLTLAGAIQKLGHRVLDGDEPPPSTEVELPGLDEIFGSDEKADKSYAKQKARDIIADIPGQHVGKVFREMAKLLYPDLYRR